MFQRRGNLGSDMMFGKALERLMWSFGMYRGGVINQDRDNEILLIWVEGEYGQ